MECYLDNAATTTVAPSVLEAMQEASCLSYGNPSSIHKMGRKAAKLVEWSRALLAQKLNVDSDEIIFTSGGTESNNLAILGVFFSKLKTQRPEELHFLCSSIEHPSVLNVFKKLSTWGAQVEFIPVGNEGLIQLEALKLLLRKETCLVSVMHANNEVGSIQPIEEVAQLCQEKGVIFHTDACQSFTRVPLPLDSIPAHLVSINSHKIHGPKGAGALFVRKGTVLSPLFEGGGHEKGLRAGTLNTPALFGFAKAVELTSSEDFQLVKERSEFFLKELTKICPEVKMNGSLDKRVGHILNLQFPGVDGPELLQELSTQGIYLSAGSACSSGKIKASHVLLAMGKSEKDSLESLRLSFSKWNTFEELAQAVQMIGQSIKRSQTKLCQKQPEQNL